MKVFEEMEQDKVSLDQDLVVRGDKARIDATRAYVELLEDGLSPEDATKEIEKCIAEALGHEFDDHWVWVENIDRLDAAVYRAESLEPVDVPADIRELAERAALQRGKEMECYEVFHGDEYVGRFRAGSAEDAINVYLTENELTADCAEFCNVKKVAMSDCDNAV
jgi:hypothetical protein